MVVRDFVAGGDFEKGASFVTGLNYANQGLLKPILNQKGKPELASTTGTYDGMAGKASGIASAESFAQWYDDSAPSSGNSHGGSLSTSLTLYRNTTGSYVNRFGANGEQWFRESLPLSHWCGYEGSEVKDADGNPIPCSYCVVDDLSTPECDNPYPIDCDDKTNLLRCEVRSGAYYGVYAEGSFDGTPLFFPADGLAPASPSSRAQIPGNYDPSWPNEPSGKMHNFSFTSEVRFWFRYEASRPLRLTFTGDDDAWVFVNKKLAIDVGGIHTPVAGSLIVNTDGTAIATVSPTTVTPGTTSTANPNLGLEDGKLYEVAVFQAERQTSASSYTLGFDGFSSAPSICAHD
jgi:fibro-slime domain-containing protein